MSRQPVLLTGASGFIGQRLQSLLLENQRGVTAVIRPGSPHGDRILPACTILNAHLSDREQLAQACAGAQAVVYCAGAVRGRRLDDFRPANVDGVAHLAEALNRCGSETPFLLISSLAASRPQISDYANSKFLGEQELKSRASFPWTIFRPPAVYGPGDQEMLPILSLARRGVIARPGPPAQRLSLIHVDDLSRAVLAWLNGWRDCTERTFTLDDGRQGGYDWKAIAEAAGRSRHITLGIPRLMLNAVAGINLGLAALFRYAPMLTPGKVRELTQDDWLCDNSELTRATGWKPSIDLGSGISQLFGRA